MSTDEDSTTTGTPRLLPCAYRVVEGKSNKSLKMSIGKNKIHADQFLSRELYKMTIINGAQYCRRHLMIYCHVCEVNNDYLAGEASEAKEEREVLGLRPAGDPRINRRANKWMHFIKEKQMEQKMEIQLLIRTHGKDHIKTAPEHWEAIMARGKKQEKEINNKFLAEVDQTFEDGAVECCYWACKKPDDEKLLRCAGCGINKYCSKEHQRLDWSWEHKGECQMQLPDFIKDEIEQDRLKCKNGDYNIDRS